MILRDTYSLRRHIIILKTSGEEWPNDLVPHMNKPVVWFRQVSKWMHPPRKQFDNTLFQDSKKLMLLCPVMGKPKVPRKLGLGYCSEESCFLGLNNNTKSNLFDICGNPFRGQNVTQSMVPSRPMMLNVGRPDRPLSGYTVRYLRMYARALEFAPSMKLGGVGNFIPQNFSFTDGIYKEVQFNQHIQFFFKKIYFFV